MNYQKIYLRCKNKLLSFFNKSKDGLDDVRVSLSQINGHLLTWDKLEPRKINFIPTGVFQYQDTVWGNEMLYYLPLNPQPEFENCDYPKEEGFWHLVNEKQEGYCFFNQTANGTWRDFTPEHRSPYRVGDIIKINLMEARVTIVDVVEHDEKSKWAFWVKPLDKKFQLIETLRNGGYIHRVDKNFVLVDCLDNIIETVSSKDNTYSIYVGFTKSNHVNYCEVLGIYEFNLSYTKNHTEDVIKKGLSLGFEIIDDNFCWTKDQCERVNQTTVDLFDKLREW